MSILIAKQHRLPSLAWLLLQLRNQEKFTHIWLTTKHYSDIPFEFPPFDGRVSEMSSDTEALESLPPAGGGLVLDEGGGLHEKVANRYSGVCVKWTPSSRQT